MWTNAQLEEARTKERLDRVRLRKMLLFAIAAGLGAASFALLDGAFTPIVLAKVAIVARQDVWDFMRGSRCIITLDTGLGPATWTEWRECTAVRWRVGQYFNALRVRRLRITGGLHVYGGLRT